MKFIKKYESFLEETNENFFKKAVVGGAMIAGLSGGMTSCDDPKNVNNPNCKTEVVEKTPIELPNSFEMNADFISIGMDMTINVNGNDIGKVEERTLNIGRTFEYFDNTGKKLTKGQEQVLSLYTDIQIFDNNDKKIGSVEQEMLESLFSLYSIYSIKDSNGNVIGKSEKLDFFTTDVEIIDNEGNTIVKMHKDAISLTDNWQVEISGNVDKRLIIFIPPFISASQKAKKDEE